MPPPRPHTSSESLKDDREIKPLQQVKLSQIEGYNAYDKSITSIVVGGFEDGIKFFQPKKRIQ